MLIGPLMFKDQPVALRKESVDRNKYVVQCRKVMGVSLSARRAWIEIWNHPARPTANTVALRKESVDRNNLMINQKKINVALRKESVDRNPVVPAELTTLVVALRKESVDRNRRNCCAGG